MKMNKQEMINKLIEKTNRINKECSLIYEIIEKHSIVGRKNKEMIETDFIEKLHISKNEADEIYNICMELLLKDYFNK